uniref:Uncharacterized protein n=1 Tax=Chelonoidis abingdonii TaxID=106734 RepID=A0A8C0GBA2_CHEAB
MPDSWPCQRQAWSQCDGASRCWGWLAASWLLGGGERCPGVLICALHGAELETQHSQYNGTWLLDIILVHYQPVGFLCLSHSVCQPLFEELLLLLQPLSLLPFSLDLLFEHHLLQMGKEQQQQKELLRVKQDLLLSVHSTLQLMRRGQEGAAWERVKGVGADGAREEEQRKAKESVWEGKRDKQAGWWYQLMQSSQVYIEGSAEGSKFIRPEKKKQKAPGVAPRLAEGRKAPPPREGVVEGAEACLLAEVAKPNERSWPSWMGSPPDSVLTELKRSKEKDNGAPQRQGVEESSPGPPNSSQPVKWGHLFGASKVQKEARQPNRLPSGWLTLDRSVFQLMAQMVGAGMWREATSEPEQPQAELPSEPPEQQLAGGLPPQIPW